MITERGGKREEGEEKTGKKWEKDRKNRRKWREKEGKKDRRTEKCWEQELCSFCSGYPMSDYCFFFFSKRFLYQQYNGQSKVREIQGIIMLMKSSVVGDTERCATQIHTHAGSRSQSNHDN